MICTIPMVRSRLLWPRHHVTRIYFISSLPSDDGFIDFDSDDDIKPEASKGLTANVDPYAGNILRYPPNSLAFILLQAFSSPRIAEKK